MGNAIRKGKGLRFHFAPRKIFPSQWSENGNAVGQANLSVTGSPSIRGEERPALRWRQLAQRPKLDAAQWVDRWRAVLGAAHVDLPRAKSMVFARPHLGIADPFGRSAVWLDCPGHQLVVG